MKKSILVFGLILGTLLCANMTVMVKRMYSNPNFQSNEIVGYTVLIVIFSLIYFGIRNYSNKYLDGYITFGKAFKTGALIAFVGATIYVIVWLICYYLFIPDFIDVYTNHVVANTAEVDIQAKILEMENFKEIFKNPIFVTLITYSEVLPLGLIVALVSALILKKKQKTVTLDSSEK